MRPFRLNWKYWYRLFCLVILINLYSIYDCFAQTSSFEFWPETDIWYTLNPSWRFSAFIPITKYYESKDRDLNIFLQLDYKWGKTKHSVYKRLMDENREMLMKGWMVRGGFMERWSLGENAGNYTEDMFLAEIHNRIPLKGNLTYQYDSHYDSSNLLAFNVILHVYFEKRKETKPVPE